MIALKYWGQFPEKDDWTFYLRSIFDACLLRPTDSEEQRTVDYCCADSSHAQMVRRSQQARGTNLRQHNRSCNKHELIYGMKVCLINCIR